MNTRKLYQIRYTQAGHTFGQTVGHKCQLKPRAVAARIAKRLRAAGIDARISPIIVNVTPAQSAYLARRYDAYTRRCLGLDGAHFEGHVTDGSTEHGYAIYSNVDLG